MKPLSECKWKVKIHHSLIKNGCWFFIVSPDAPMGLEWQVLYGKDYKSKQGAKRNWEKFAEINNIKNWEWV